MKKKKLSTAEWWEQLSKDPAYIAMRAGKEEEREEILAEARRIEAPIVEALKSQGINVESVGDLMNTEMPYPKALPVLLEHLQRPYDDKTRETLARALAVREARKIAWEPILTIVARNWSQLGEGTKDGLMVALSVMAMPSDLPKLIELISDKTLGPSRVLLVRKFMRSKKHEARKTLEMLRSDPDLHKEIDYRRRPKSHH